ncbi:reverse transcriptase domain-containing protein [Tanacetum coccineum]
MLATRGSGKVTTMEARANKTKGIRKLQEGWPLNLKFVKQPLLLGIERTRTCYACGSLRHYKSECPIEKFQKHVDMIHRGVRASKPKTRQDAIEFATKLMDKKISTPAKRQAENKSKLDNTSKNNHNQQQSNKRQNTGRAYTAGHGEKKHYSGSKLLNDCPERKNQNHENQTGGTGARGVVHAFRGGETKHDLNNIEDEIDA